MRTWLRYRWRGEAVAAGYEHERRGEEVPEEYVRDLLVSDEADGFIEGQQRACHERDPEHLRAVARILRSAGVPLPLRHPRYRPPEPPMPQPIEVWDEGDE